MFDKIFKKYFFTAADSQKGDVTILLSVLLMSILLMVVLSASRVILLELKMSRETSDSTSAFFAADAGAEKCLYEARKTVGGCAIIGRSTSVSLLSGLATATAQRVGPTATVIESIGTFSASSRKIRIEGTIN